MSNDQQPAAIPFNDEVGFILSRPNFWCARYANFLRLDGVLIPHRAEAEQAAVIHWMLNLYLKHGDSWRDVAECEAVRMQQIGKGSNERGIRR